MTTFKMPAGKYYIGDLCYVMKDKWGEFCKLTLKNHECIDGKFTYEDGVQTCHFSTYYGDGVYYDQFRNAYGVDAGLIGIIKLEDLKQEKAEINLGNVFEFNEPFTCYKKEGVLHFGHIVIDTKNESEDDEECDEEYEDI